VFFFFLYVPIFYTFPTIPTYFQPTKRMLVGELYALESVPNVDGWVLHLLNRLVFIFLRSSKFNRNFLDLPKLLSRSC